jgi:hypothetical protein
MNVRGQIYLYIRLPIAFTRYCLLLLRNNAGKFLIDSAGCEVVKRQIQRLASEKDDGGAFSPYDNSG